MNINEVLAAIQSNRRARLKELIATYNNQADFVAKSGVSQSEASSLLKDKSFGESKARKIEIDCGLPLGWFDITAGAASAAPRAVPAARPVPKIDLAALIDSTFSEIAVMGERLRRATAEGFQAPGNELKESLNHGTNAGLRITSSDQEEFEMLTLFRNVEPEYRESVLEALRQAEKASAPGRSGTRD